MRWTQRFFRREQAERRLDAELQFHLEEQTADLIASGLPAEEAARRARLRFGGVDSAKEACREVGAGRFLEILAQDLRYGWRQLRRHPGFAATAILTLALAIGANAAIFSLVNAAMFRSLPVPHPNELVRLQWKSPHASTQYLSYPMFESMRRHNRVFSGMFAFYSLQLATQLDGEPGLAAGQLVSGNFFSVLGVHPAIGRTFTARADRTPGGAPLAVISYGYWKRQFGLSPSVIGRKIVLNGTPFTIIGVAPADFSSVIVGDARDIWLPMMMQADVMDGKPLLANRRSWWLQVMARRRAGVSLSQAAANINLVYRNDARRQEAAAGTSAAANELAKESIVLWPAANGISGLQRGFSESLLVILALVGVLFLIACVNLASLSLARARARQKEIAVRSALGAGRSRLVRQLLTESLLLAAIGGAAGLLLAVLGDRLLLRFLSLSGTPVALDASLDAHVWIFTLAVTALAGALIGSAPVWHSLRIDTYTALKSRTGSPAGASTRHKSKWDLHRILIAGEVALALLLLSSAGLLVRSLQNLDRVHPGFNPSHVVLVDVDPPLVGYRGARLTSLYQQISRTIAALPGVRAQSLSALPPMTAADWQTGVFVQGRVPGLNEKTTVSMNLVGPEFFRTLGIPLLQGRGFTANDTAAAPKVAVINEAMARYYFGREPAVGRRLSFVSPSGGEIQIVGVARNVKRHNLSEPAQPLIYLPFTQTPAASMAYGMTLEVRTAGSSESMVRALRAALRGIDPDIPILHVAGLGNMVNNALGEQRMVAELSSLFGLAALLLAAIGLYGIMSYTVTRRTGEIGIRMALGAEAGDVLWMVLRDSLVLVGFGLAAGIPVSLAFGHAIASQLYGVSSCDPLTFAAVFAVLAAIALAASYLPARRAAHVSPTVALQQE